MQRDAKLAKCIEGKIVTGLINDKRARKALQRAVSLRVSYKAEEMYIYGS
jgi:hypothetical protein